MMESSDQTIRRVLAGYRIGQKIRRIRMGKKLSLTDLGLRIGMSGSMLSQLENGNLIPTLPTLARIAEHFGLGLDIFFSDDRTEPPICIVRAEERIRFPEVPGEPRPAYFFEELAFSAVDKSICPYLAEFPKRNPEEVRQHVHEGSEFIYVVEGVLGIGIGVRGDREDYTLNPGDSVRFAPCQLHCYYGLSETPARALVIITRD